MQMQNKKVRGMQMRQAWYLKLGILSLGDGGGGVGGGGEEGGVGC